METVLARVWASAFLFCKTEMGGLYISRLRRGLRHAQIAAHCQGSECDTARLTKRVTALEEKLQRLEQFVIEAEDDLADDMDYDVADDLADVHADVDADEDNGASGCLRKPWKDDKDPILIVAP